MSLIFLIFGLAFADDIVTLEKGERAPFSGTLLSPAAAAKIITKTDYTLEKCLIDAKRDKSILEAKLNFEKNNIEAELAACTLKYTEMEKLYEQQIDYLEKRSVSPQWESSAYFTGGVLIGAGIVYGSSLILKNIQTSN
jgi:hypothetical protein